MTWKEVILPPPQPANEVLGVYWFHPVCLSVRLSVSLSVCLSLCPRLWTWFCPLMFWEMSSWFFVKICILITHHLKMCTSNCHIDWIIFLYFTGFFSVFGLGLFFYNKNACSVLKHMKNFDYVYNYIIGEVVSKPLCRFNNVRSYHVFIHLS